MASLPRVQALPRIPETSGQQQGYPPGAAYGGLTAQSYRPQARQSSRVGSTLYYTPSYQPKLQPIEFIWGTVKQKMARRLSTSMIDMDARLKKFMSEVTSSQWVCAHGNAQAFEDKYAGLDDDRETILLDDLATQVDEAKNEEMRRASTEDSTAARSEQAGALVCDEAMKSQGKRKAEDGDGESNASGGNMLKILTLMNEGNRSVLDLRKFMFERELEEPKKEREREVEELQCDFEERKMDRQQGIPRTTWLTWLSKKDAYLTTERNKRCLALGGQGRHVAMQFANDLLAFMKAVRADSHLLTTAHMVTWIKTHPWVETYLQREAASGTGYDGLLGLGQRFAHRHGFAQRVPCYSKLKRAELESRRMRLRRPSGRSTMRRLYETSSMWMKQQCTMTCHLDELLKYELVGPSVLLVDNLAAHVSYTSRRTVDEELYGFLEPLPPNTTSVFQPLDVGVMGPLKAKLRSLWLQEKPVKSAAEKRMKMIERTIKAWESLSESAVKRSFEKALPRVPRERCE
ncbi:hypothetical protein DYB30_011867 [Aphanomyces astaci]|uniref:DDE-1 domain-containing protein n=1 Tax=Aphanomyces astaci TaxID=112090 RepID=A0A397C5G3_APHAT|nr:hypothetical protein DYB30_011867 [Aphanomyces astaci]